MDIYERIVKAKIYIDENYHRPLDLNALSAEACYSKYHFLRLFKKTYKKTPHQYLIERRIDKAKEKLKTSQGSVISVCNEVGFESTPSFSLKFKEQTGEAPASYRLRSMNNEKLSREHPDHFIPACFNAMFNPKD